MPAFDSEGLTVSVESELDAALAELRLRHAAVLDEARPQTVERQHSRGSLTARERVAVLFDKDGPWMEYGALARPFMSANEAAGDAVVRYCSPVSSIRAVGAQGRTRDWRS